MCECVQEHIKTLWRHRITGNAIKAAVCVRRSIAAAAAALRPACLHIKRITAVCFTLGC